MVSSPPPTDMIYRRHDGVELIRIGIDGTMRVAGELVAGAQDVVHALRRELVRFHGPWAPLDARRIAGMFLRARGDRFDRQGMHDVARALRIAADDFEAERDP